MSRHRIAVVVPKDFTLFDLGVAVEVFASPRPELEREWYDVRVCTADPGRADVMGGLFGVSIAHGVEVIDDADTVIVPQACRLDQPAEPSVIEAIRRAHERGARLISFCTGAFVLAAAGALDGRPAATHWKYARRLAIDYPRVRVNPEVLYVDDGQVLTSAGTAAGIDLSLHVIRKDHGAQVARHISRSMVVAPHREGGQAQFILAPVPSREPQQNGVARAMDHVSHHLDEDLSIQELAALAFMSPRNFSRRFRQDTGTTPAQWVLQQRLTRARQLLEETDMPIERIAAETGFGSSVTMRQRFTSSLLTSPSAYRKAFRAGFEIETVRAVTFSSNGVRRWIVEPSTERADARGTSPVQTRAAPPVSARSTRARPTKPATELVWLSRDGGSTPTVRYNAIQSGTVATISAVGDDQPQQVDDPHADRRTGAAHTMHTTRKLPGQRG